MKKIALSCCSIFISTILNACSGTDADNGEAVASVAQVVVNTDSSKAKKAQQKILQEQAKKQNTIKPPENKNELTNVAMDNTGEVITPNAYGLGVNSDQYGRATQYKVIDQPNADNKLLDVKKDAYGLGVGMDQYGRPVENKNI